MSAVLLRVEGIRKSYGHLHSRPVLRDVGLEVKAGALVGVVGENGAGKSTLLKILAGELRPNAGRVTFAGSLGYCPQAVVLNESLTVAQHFEYFRAAYGMSDLGRADDLIETLGYTQYRKSVVATLSGGTRQKLNLTLALMHDPQVLLLDEPYQGFDWETYLRFWDVAADLRARGRAIVVISHLVFDQERFDALYQLRDGYLRPAEVSIHTKDRSSLHA